ncbi:WD repeat-containing protein 26, putative [Plasmodium ovale]|uniref:WD repeat-containing protein 26, putative n=2 Tax=Plasmodium ovale TaxID=36330 RepID=A0A1A8WKC5_PLAOA|nr:WD repeat-containing protein 26, putative [Plasmodium ovale curtisi]SBS92595.1 WD repeat-containing protein 26, putative [Plasmodium ovale curtisi]SCQ16479.1 WD repeat-containing protein 26, putative [Plasmodium ovale]
MNITSIIKRDKRKRQEEISHVIRKKLKHSNMLKSFESNNKNEICSSSLLTKSNEHKNNFSNNNSTDGDMCLRDGERENADGITYNGGYHFTRSDKFPYEKMIYFNSFGHDESMRYIHTCEEEVSNEIVINEKGHKAIRCFRNNKDVAMLKGRYKKITTTEKKGKEKKKKKKKRKWGISGSGGGSESGSGGGERGDERGNKRGSERGSESGSGDGESNRGSGSGSGGGGSDYVWEGLLKKDVILLLIQAIKNMGYRKSAKYLELESGIELEQPIVKEMHKNILSGKWKNAVCDLRKLHINKILMKAIGFLIYEQCFIEYLYQGKYFAALRCLRNKLEKCCFDEDTYDRLHQCTTFFTALNNTYLEKSYKIHFKNSRKILFEKINRLLPEHIILPPRRLAILLHQSLKYQVENCLFHNNFSEMKLINNLMKCKKAKKVRSNTKMSSLSRRYNDISKIEKWKMKAKAKEKVNIHDKGNINLMTNIFSGKQEFTSERKNSSHSNYSKCNNVNSESSIFMSEPKMNNLEDNTEDEEQPLECAQRREYATYVKREKYTTHVKSDGRTEWIGNAKHVSHVSCGPPCGYMDTTGVWVCEDIEDNQFNVTNGRFLEKNTKLKSTQIRDGSKKNCDDFISSGNNNTSVVLINNAMSYQKDGKTKYAKADMGERKICTLNGANFDHIKNPHSPCEQLERGTNAEMEEGKNQLEKEYSNGKHNGCFFPRAYISGSQNENGNHSYDELTSCSPSGDKNTYGTDSNLCNVSSNDISNSIIDNVTECKNETSRGKERGYAITRVEESETGSSFKCPTQSKESNDLIQDNMEDDETGEERKVGTLRVNLHSSNHKLLAVSLLKNHECRRIKLPYYCIKILQGHKDEVWYVDVSCNGKYIASASKDRSIYLWRGKSPFNKLREWNGHVDGVSYIIWSHNSKYLVSGSNDSNIIIWSPKSNKKKLSLTMHSGPITSICWSKDDSIIVSSAFDKKIFCTKLNEQLKGFSILYAWSFSTRIQNFVFTNNEKYLIVVPSDKNVRVIDYNMKKELYILPEYDSITSLCASNMYNHILVNIADQKPTIKLWDVKYRYIIQTYRGHKQGRFIVHSTFGGKNEDYVISGSEDSLIYIWHKTKGYLLDVINGHASTVSIAIWPLASSKFPYMISASDDHTLMIWNVHPRVNNPKKDAKKKKKKFIHPFLRELTKFHSLKS